MNCGSSEFILEDVVGGVTISTTRIPSTTKFLWPGTPLAASASSVGLYNIVKTAKLKVAITTAACVTIYVYSSDLPNAPGHYFKVGEHVMLDGKGSACTIASITIGTKTSGVGTDTIIFTAGGGGFNTDTVAIGRLLLEAANDVTTGAAAKFDADCLLRDTVRVRLESGYTLQNIIAGAVVRGSVDESILPVGCPSEAVKTPLTARMRFA
jgi:hypothetical protein